VIALVANLFTAVFVSRAIFEWQLFRRPRLGPLNIWPRKNGELFRAPNIAFMSRRALTLGVSALAVAGSIGLLAVKGIEYGLDFGGGTLTYVRFAALLTRIGYSMNDKIVVFDRVRENQAEAQ
jgi:preprotein translocase subunit SecF